MTETLQAKNGKNIVVTGVSSGIGHEMALCLAKKGYRVFGSVRKAADSVALETALGDRFHRLLFDVCDKQSISSAAADVSEICLLYTSPSPRDQRGSRMPSSA